MMPEIKRPTRSELIKKMCPAEIAEDEKLLEVFTLGFKKAWTYKEIERRCAVASSRSWRSKYERLLKENEELPWERENRTEEDIEQLKEIAKQVKAKE